MAGPEFTDRGKVAEVRVPLPAAAATKQAVSVKIEPQSLRVEVTVRDDKHLFVDANPLFALVDKNKSNWRVEARPPAVWPQLTGSATIQQAAAAPASNQRGEDTGAGEALAARARVNSLLRAAQEGNVELLRLSAKACDEGAGVAAVVQSVRDGNGRSPLHFAALNGHTGACAYLVEELGVAVDLADDHGETPLLLAARGGHEDAAVYLLSKGADPAAKEMSTRAQALHHAAAEGANGLAEALLARGVDVNAPSNNGPPLLWAAGHGHCETVQLLLEHAAEPSAAREDGVTALMMATAAGDLDTVKVLLDAKADTNLRATGGVTPLFVAADSGFAEVVAELLKAGADANLRDQEGDTPISAAALAGQRNVIELLLPRTTPDPNVPSWDVQSVMRAYAPSIAAQSASSKPTSHAATPTAWTIEPVSPEAAAQSLKLKQAGDEAYRQKQFDQAIALYSQALQFDRGSGVLHSNRSIARLHAGDLEGALQDGQHARVLRPDWAKASVGGTPACFREGAAYRAMKRYEDAATAFFEGCQLDPENMELVNAFRHVHLCIEAQQSCTRSWHCLLML
eukprot:jgi/Chlat1/8303/Chrsp78S07739